MRKCLLPFGSLPKRFDVFLAEVDRQTSTAIVASISLACTAIFWLGVLRTDATPYGDGSRIMPFIRMFNHNPSIFPFWSYRNNGEPILASPEHFYLLSYLIDWDGGLANIQLNALLFLSILFFAGSAFVLAKHVTSSNLLAGLYSVGTACNGIIIVAERSARFQQITVLTVTLFCTYLFLSNHKYRNWGIPFLVGISIYNSMHYGLFPIISLLALSIFSGHGLSGITRVLLYALGGIFVALPFLLPVIFHPITSGEITPDQYHYQISVIKIEDLWEMVSGKNLDNFIGYQSILIIPLACLVVAKGEKGTLLYLTPVIPWLYFIVAGYSETLKNFIEATPVSNWRHVNIFFQSFMIFSTLFLVAAISRLENYRSFFVACALFATMATYVDTFESARANNLSDESHTLLHHTNEISIWQSLLEGSSRDLSFSNRVYSASGMHIPEYRSFTSFSYFMSNGYWILRSAATPEAKFAQRPHWVDDGKRGNCNDFAAILPYAGYRYLICFPWEQDIGNGFNKINEGKWGIFENPNVKTLGRSCEPEKTLTKELVQECEQDVHGNAAYYGDRIVAKIKMRATETVFFHENYAWGWLGWIDGEFFLPRRVNGVFIGVELPAGEYNIELRYVDPFFVIGLLLSSLYFLVTYFWPRLSGSVRH